MITIYRERPYLLPIAFTADVLVSFHNNLSLCVLTFYGDEEKHTGRIRRKHYIGGTNFPCYRRILRRKSDERERGAILGKGGGEGVGGYKIRTTRSGTYVTINLRRVIKKPSQNGPTSWSSCAILSIIWMFFNKTVRTFVLWSVCMCSTQWAKQYKCIYLTVWSNLTICFALF